MLNAPFAPMVALVFPAATGFPLAVVKPPQEINNTPSAGDPSARYTVSFTCVVAGPPCACATCTPGPIVHTSDAETIHTVGAHTSHAASHAIQARHFQTSLVIIRSLRHVVFDCPSNFRPKKIRPPG